MTLDPIDKFTTYRPAFLPLFLVIFGLGLLTGAVVRWFLFRIGVETPGVISYTYLQLAALVYLWAMVATALVVWILGVQVSSGHLGGRTFWGMDRRIAWGDVASARRTGPPGLRFLKVYSVQGGAPLWVPLFLKHRARFFEEVELHTPAGHPMRAPGG